MPACSWRSVALAPTHTQAQHLRSWLDLTSDLWAMWLTERNEDRLSFAAQSRQIKDLRQQQPYDVLPTPLLRSTCWALSKSYETGTRTPKQRTALEWAGQSGWTLNGGRLVIKPLGEIRVRGQLPETADKLTIVSRGGRWTAYFRTETEETVHPHTGKTCGIDLGIRSLAITGGGYMVSQHPSLTVLRRKLQGHRNKLKRATPGSRRWQEHRRRIERTEDRIKAAQADLAHRTAKDLLDRYDILFVEAINPDGATIQNDPIYRKAAHDANWQLFTDVLIHHAENAVGKRVVLVPAWYSSQTCSRCEMYVPKRLQDRTHECPYCDLVLDRDVNAARVIQRRGQLLLNGVAVFDQDWRPIGHPKRPT